MPDPDPYRLPASVVPSRYDLTLEPDLDAATFAGFESVAVRIAEAVDEIRLNALDLVIEEGWLEAAGGHRVDVTATLDAPQEQVVLTLAEQAEPGDWTLHLRFTGELNDRLTGFYRSTFSGADGTKHTIATTQFEATHARRAFPCWDEPARKAVFSVTLVVPEDLAAISNAAEVSTEATGDGRRTVRFADTIKMSTYLVAFVVGPLEMTDPIDVNGTSLRIVYPPGGAHLTAFAQEVGAFALNHLAGYYGIDYPGDKLDLVAVPDFSFGAMENLGCVTFRETLLLIDGERASQGELQRVADVVAHEIAHMWFGDLVTMSWWNGIWLNEAFATFMEMLTTDAFRPNWDRWTDFGIARSAAFDTDSLSTTRPIEYTVTSPEDAEGMFDVLTYEKGAAVVRMLEQYLGAEAFRAGIGAYLRANAYANTETTDLWDAIEDAVGEPTRRIMDSWIFQAGHPVVTVSLSADRRTVHLAQEQFRYAGRGAGATSDSGTDSPKDPGAPRWVIPIVLRIGRGQTTEITKVLLDADSIDVDLGEPVDWVVGNDRGSGFYRVTYQGALLDTLASRAQRDLTALERYGMVEDVWAGVLAGRVGVDRLLTTLRAFADETDLSVWQRIVGVLSALERFVPPSSRRDLAVFVRALIGPAAKRLGPDRVDGESDRVSSLRAVLLGALAEQGDDETVHARAEELYARLGQPGESVDPELGNVAVRIVATSADEERFADLRARSVAATTPQDKLRYLGALADVADPALFGRSLDLTLSEEVRTQDAPFLLRRALLNRVNGPAAWAFVAQHWDILNARLPSAGIPRMLEGIRVVTAPELAEGIAAFLSTHPVPQGQKAVEQHIERMAVSVALRDREAERLAAVLA